MNNEIAFSSLEKLYPQFNIKKLAEKKVILIGIGGVGSWCAEALVRSGIKKLKLIDLDEICISNSNRQVHTLLSTIGQPKVVVMKKRLDQICDDLEIQAVEQFVTPKNVEKLLLNEADIIIDACDSLEAKVSLAEFSLIHQKKLITCGAAGGKSDATKIDYAPLNQTVNDRLLKHLRKKLRRDHARDEIEYGKIMAIFSRQKVSPPAGCQLDDFYLKPNCQGSLGSSVMVTASMGLVAAQKCLEEIINHD